MFHRLILTCAALGALACVPIALARAPQAAPPACQTDPHWLKTPLNN